MSYEIFVKSIDLVAVKDGKCVECEAESFFFHPVTMPIKPYGHGLNLVKEISEAIVHAKKEIRKILGNGNSELCNECEEES